MIGASTSFESFSFGVETPLVAVLEGFVEWLDRAVFCDRAGTNEGPTKQSTKSDTLTDLDS